MKQSQSSLKVFFSFSFCCTLWKHAGIYDESIAGYYISRYLRNIQVQRLECFNMHTVLDWRTFWGCISVEEEEGSGLKKYSNCGFHGHLDSDHCQHGWDLYIHHYISSSCFDCKGTFPSSWSWSSFCCCAWSIWPFSSSDAISRSGPALEQQHEQHRLNKI